MLIPSTILLLHELAEPSLSNEKPKIFPQRGLEAKVLQGFSPKKSNTKSESEYFLTLGNGKPRMFTEQGLEAKVLQGFSIVKLKSDSENSPVKAM